MTCIHVISASKQYKIVPCTLLIAVSLSVALSLALGFLPVEYKMPFKSTFPDQLVIDNTLHDLVLQKFEQNRDRVAIVRNLLSKMRNTVISI